MTTYRRSLDTAIGERLTLVVRESFAPRENLSVSEWSEKHRQIVSGDVRGPWRGDRTPYLQGVMDAYHEDGIRYITIKGGSQTGKTQAVWNVLFFHTDRAGGTVMYVLPDADSAHEQNKFRILPNVRACAPLAARLSTRAHDIQGASLRFDNADWLYRGAHSEHKLESFDAGLVIVDEVDRCPDETCHLAKQRIKTIADGRVVMCGKPGLKGQGVDREYDESDRRVYMVPCPECGLYHERTLALLRWHGRKRDGTEAWDSRDLGVSPGVAHETACIKCPNPACRCRIGPERNTWQLRMGVWAKAGQGVTPLEPLADDAETPEARWKGPGTVHGAGAKTNHAGFHIPELISGVTAAGPYAGTVKDFVERRGEVDQHFLSDRLGLAWSPTGKPPELTELRKGIKEPRDGGHRLGTIPDWVMVLIATVDVQVGGCFVEVSGYGVNGRESCLVWHEQVPCPEGGGLWQLDEVLYRRLWRAAGGESMRIAVRGIDSGDRTDEVYEYCRTRNTKGACVAVKGVGESSQNGLDTLHQWRRIDKAPDGRVIAGGVRLLRINSHAWKRVALARLGVREAGRANGIGVDLAEDTPDNAPAGVVGGLYALPYDVSDVYLEQVTAEECATTRTGTRTRHEWRMRQGRQHNHYFDTRYYNLALADASGVRMVASAVHKVRSEPVQAPEKPRPQQAAANPLIEQQRQHSLLRKPER